MSYLNALDAELRAVNVNFVRRRRIISEFADHLHEDPHADLGDPRALARQFADELRTRMARRIAMIAFAGLAVTGVACAAVFLIGTRIVLLPPGVHRSGTVSHRPSWLAPFWMMTAQVAFASGTLALIRAWRLRHESVITGPDARILLRRACIGLVAGVLTAGALPVGVTGGSREVYVRSPAVGALCLLMLLVMLAFALLITRFPSSRSGVAHDLSFDLGVRDPRVTPLRLALALSAAIFVVLAAAGLVTDDSYDGLARGLADATACLLGFIVLGRYLGLRTTRDTAQ